MSPRLKKRFLNHNLIWLLLFANACSHLPPKEEIVAKHSTVLSSEDVDLNRSLKNRGGNSPFMELTFIGESFHSFVSNGLQVSILMPNRLENAGFIRVENYDYVFPAGTDVITLVMKFGLPIEDNFKVFQVVGGIDSISRSVEYQDSTLLSEFFLGANADANALESFSFGMYFELDEFFDPLNIVNLIREVKICPTGIELTILDDSLEILETKDERRSQKSVLQIRNLDADIPKNFFIAENPEEKWPSILRVLHLYRIGMDQSIIAREAQDRFLDMEESVDFSYVGPANKHRRD